MSEGLGKAESPNERVCAGAVPVSRYLAFTAIAAVGLAADLISKQIVFDWPGQLGQIEYWWWEGYAGIQTSLNEGALFGLGYGAVPVFAGISIVAAIAIPAWLFLGKVAHDWWLTCALGAVMSGVLGNLYDRLGLHGLTWTYPEDRVGQSVYAVRDWILWRINEQWTWPNFNLADAFLVTGAGVLMLRTFFEPVEPAASDATTQAKPPHSSTANSTESRS